MCATQTLKCVNVFKMLSFMLFFFLSKCNEKTVFICFILLYVPNRNPNHPKSKIKITYITKPLVNSIGFGKITYVIIKVKID